MTLFTKGAINSSVRQLMNRNVATFGKGGNGELVEAFQSGQHLIIKKVRVEMGRLLSNVMCIVWKSV